MPQFSHGERLTIPSPIDVHIHLREPGGEDKETIETGTQAARAGGYQAVFDMPNNPNGNETWTEEKIDEKISIASRTANTSIGFYAGVNPEEPAVEEFPALVQKSAGLKLYMGHTTNNVKERDLEVVRPSIDAWIANAREAGVAPPILLHAREGVGAETAAYVAEQEYPVHWCHISTASEANMAAKLTHNFPAYYTGGVTLHHLTMTERNADFQQGWFGARMQPPLGKEFDADSLLAAYTSGTIQILETDHAPHTDADKQAAEAQNPEGSTDPDCVTCFGVTGVEFVLPVMTSLVQRNEVTMERLVDSLYYQPAKMLGLKLAREAVRNTTEIQFSAHPIREYENVGRSRNAPYFGWAAASNVVGTYRNGPYASRPQILKFGEQL